MIVEIFGDLLKQFIIIIMPGLLEVTVVVYQRCVMDCSLCRLYHLLFSWYDWSGVDNMEK